MALTPFLQSVSVVLISPEIVRTLTPPDIAKVQEAAGKRTPVGAQALVIAPSAGLRVEVRRELPHSLVDEGVLAGVAALLPRGKQPLQSVGFNFVASLQADASEDRAAIFKMMESMTDLDAVRGLLGRRSGLEGRAVAVKYRAHDADLTIELKIHDLRVGGTDVARILGINANYSIEGTTTTELRGLLKVSEFEKYASHYEALLNRIKKAL